MILVRRERKPRIQGVKPTMQVRTGGRFDEHALGFPTFAAFVDAAVAAGVIAQRRDPAGRLLMPIGTSLTFSTRRPSIRQDLWKAFTDWSGRTYVWDRDTRSAREKPANDDGTAGERFVPIPLASEAEHLDWARQFVESKAGDRTADALLVVLSGEDARFEQFSTLIHSNPRLEGEWKGERRRLVADAIGAWAETPCLASIRMRRSRRHYRLATFSRCQTHQTRGPLLGSRKTGRRPDVRIGTSRTASAVVESRRNGAVELRVLRAQHELRNVHAGRATRGGGAAR